jgi:hypothetical protein
MVRALKTVKISASDLILAFKESNLPDAETWFQDEERQAQILFELVSELRQKHFHHTGLLSISVDDFPDHVGAKYAKWLEKQSFFFDEKMLSTGTLGIGPLLRSGITRYVSGQKKGFTSHRVPHSRYRQLARFMRWTMDGSWKSILGLANQFMRNESLEQQRHEFWDMRGYSLKENAREAGWVLLTHLRLTDKRIGLFLSLDQFFHDLSESVAKAREQMEIYDE